MSKPAIIVVAYNRPDSLQRLLQSLEGAVYDDNNIQLIISIDFGGNEKVVKLAEDFSWQHGNKKVYRHDAHLGLKDHILWCGNLSEKYESVIILEDDLMVSPYFYRFSCKAISFFEHDEKIAGIGLYNYQVAESCFKRFDTLVDGFDNYFIQIPCSWGQCWTSAQLKGFKNWLESDGKPKSSLPSYAQKWPPSSWKKLYFQYIIDTNKYFVYPTRSLTTNFADQGTHFPGNMNIFQVPLLNIEYDFSFTELEKSLNRYDGFFEMEASCFAQYWADNKELIELDLYGKKDQNHVSTAKVYTCKSSSHSIESYGNNMHPLINNVMFSNFGNEIILSRSVDVNWNQKSNDLVNANLVNDAHKQPFRKAVSIRNYFKNWYVRIKLIIKNKRASTK